MNKRYTISGRVQGVGFRYYALQQAQRLGVTGHVRNTEEGRVEVLAQGTKAALDAFEEALQQGPPAARVDQITTQALPVTDSAGAFCVRY